MIYLLEWAFLVDYIKRQEQAMSIVNIETLFDLLEEKGEPEKLKLYDVVNGEAHIPVSGVLTRKISWIDMILGTATKLTYDQIAEAVGQADLDPQVERIVLDVNSPGGYLDGVDVSAQAVGNAEKPTEARVDNLAASAAYWISSQTDKITATSPVAAFGSIGVIIDFLDPTRYFKEMGLDRVLIASTDAPEKKAAYEPLTKKGEKVWQKELDDLHGVFASRVAEGRKTTPEKVNSDFGRGAVLIAEDAKKVGMIDKIKGISKQDIGETEGVAPDEAAPEAAISNTGEVKNMNLDELKKENPVLHAEIFEAGREEGEAKGIKQERERVLALIGWKEADTENEKVASIVAEAIASGKSEEEVKPQLSVAVRDFAKGPGAEGENPPGVSTAATSTGAGAGDGYTAEEIAAAEKAGLSVEDLKKYGPKGKEE